jgi:hypothetical protein
VIETAVPRDSPMPQPIQDLLARVTSEPVLTQMAGQEWELLVGTWTGLPLAPGRSEARVEQAIPMLPGVKVPMQIAIVVGERAPCPRGGVSRDCVNLEMRSSVDQNGMAPVMAALLKGVTVVTVRLEAETMLPHDLSMVRTGDVTVRENGKSVSARQVDRRTSRFVYPSK